jgi:hypothetical protein
MELKNLTKFLKLCKVSVNFVTIKLFTFMQRNEQLRLKGIEKLQSLVTQHNVQDLFTSSVIYREHKPQEGIEGTKNKIERIFNDIAKELSPYREQLTLLYKDYDFLIKNGMPLAPINPPAYSYIANTYQSGRLFLHKFHNLLEITEHNFLHFLHNTFILDLMCWSKFLGSPLELHLELLYSFKKIWNDEKLCENKIKLKEESDKIVRRYGKIVSSVEDFGKNYLTNLGKQISQFQIEKYLIWHIYIRHIEETRIDETGNCFPKDFDNEKLCNLLITILNKPHFSALGYKTAAVYVYHEEQIYTVVLRDNLIHTFFPCYSEKITKLPPKHKEGGGKKIINLDEVPEEFKK